MFQKNWLLFFYDHDSSIKKSRTTQKSFYQNINTADFFLRGENQ